MRATPFKRLLLSRWKLHTPCALLCLLACVPILWPQQPPRGAADTAVEEYAGMLLFGLMLFSGGMMALNVLHLLLRLRNKRACGYLFAWAGQWALAALAFVLMALAADVPPLPEKEAPLPIQQTDTLYPAKDELTGPSALVIPIDPTDFAADVVGDTPNLRLLEAEHGALFADFLAGSPRWAPQEDDTFYSRPGHVVMLPPATGGTPGLVHVCFRQVAEGDPLPQGYEVVKPGDPFPQAASDKEQVPDLALELGGRHYLLLAWRGTSHRETAHKALNAAIAAVDSRMQELADKPTPETAQQLNKGKLNMTGSRPVLRLCEPPAQYGAYQAEIYANPHEPGTLLVYIRELESNRTLRILNCPAQYSDKENELFRHDIPGSVPQWMRGSGFSSGSRHLFAPETPLFAIQEGEPHKYYGVAFEVKFRPNDPRQPSRLILRRCYKVENYEKPAPVEPRPSAAKRTPDELTPEVTLPEKKQSKDTPPEPKQEPKPQPEPEPVVEEPAPEPEPPVVEPTAVEETPAEPEPPAEEPCPPTTDAAPLG